MKRLLLGGLTLVLLTASGCGSTGQACDPSLCAGGCCDPNGLCQAGTETTACGSAGFLCVACEAGQACVAGACTVTGGTGGGASGLGGGEQAGGAGGGDAGGSAGQGGGAAGGTAGGTTAADVTVTLVVNGTGGQVKWTFGNNSGVCPGSCAPAAPAGSRFEASATHDELTDFGGFGAGCGSSAIDCLAFPTTDLTVRASFYREPLSPSVSTQRPFTVAQSNTLTMTLAAGPDGGVWAAGKASGGGTVDFGGQSVSNKSYLASFDAQGTVRSLRTLPQRGDFDIRDVDSRGASTVLAGRCSGSASFAADGGMPLPAGPCVVKLDASGAVQWARGWANTGTLQRVAVSASTGAVAFAGSASGALDLGTGALTAYGGGDFVFGLLDANGNTVLARRGGRSNDDRPGGVAFASNGDVVFSAQIYGGPASFETIQLTQANFQTATVIARYTAAGTFVNGKGLSGQVLAKDLLADSAGAVYFVGDYSNTVDFGGISRNAGAGLTSHGVVVKYDAAFAAQWVAEGYGEPDRASLAADGSIALVGYFYRYLQWGPGYVLGDPASSTASSGFAVQLNADGTVAWVKRISSGATRSAAFSAGRLWLAGEGRMTVGTPGATASPYLLSFPH